MWTLLRIALRNVARNRRRTLLTLAAVLVGVGVMVTTQGLLNGLQHALVSGVVDGQIGAIQIHRRGYLKNVLSSPLELAFPVDAALLAKVASVPGVKAVAPRIVFAGMVNAGDETLFLQAVGIDPSLEFKVCPERPAAFDPGAAFGAGPPARPPGGAPDDPPPVDDGVILSRSLAEGIGATRGKLGALLANDRDGALSGENVHVAGTMTVSTPGAESQVGLVPLPLAQRLLHMEGRATELAVAVDDVDRADQVADALRQRLGPEFEVHTWDNIAIFVREIQERENLVVNVIAAIFLLLVLLGVANTMLMSVLDRTREIGTMMAVGLRRETIVAMFLCEALALGGLGGAIGAGAGMLAVGWLHGRGIVLHMPGQAVPFTIHPVVGWPYLASVVVLAAVGGMVFASYPAWRAGRLRPVEALAGPGVKREAMIRTFLRLALRNVRRHRARTALSLSAIGFGVLMTIFLGGFSRGLTNVFTDDSVKGRSGSLQVHLKGYFAARAADPLDFDMEAGGRLEERIRAVPGVTGVAPRLVFQALVSGPGATSVLMVSGEDPALEYKVLPWAPGDVVGSPLSAAAPSGCILGLDLADALGLVERRPDPAVKRGASATISASRKGGQQNALDADVIGLLRGGTPYDSQRTGAVPLAFAQDLLDMKGRANEYLVSVNRPGDVPAVKARLQAALGPAFDVRDWREIRPFVADLIDLQERVLVFVCFVFLIIAVFGVVNTMLMSVYERTREIGTMMAVGVRRHHITILFLIEGGILAVVGGAAGAAGGVALVSALAARGGILITPRGSVAIRYLVPDAPLALVGIALIAAAVGSVAAAAYPAWRASRLRPVEALREA